MDSLLILPESKLIVNIELRQTKKLSKLRKAANQSKQNISVFKKMFQPVLSGDWKFITALCFPKLELKRKESEPCTNCKNFMLGEKEMFDMKVWVEKLIRVEKYKGEHSNNNNDQYIHMVDTIFLSLIHKANNLRMLVDEPGFGTQQTKRYQTLLHNAEKINKLMMSSIEHSKQTENLLVHNITKNGDIQQLVHQSNQSILIIDGDHGVGKTYVLQERAKYIARNNPTCKLAYLNLSSYNPQQLKDVSIMDFVAEFMFKDFENIDVITTKHLDQITFKSSQEVNIYALIYKYFQEHNQYTNIFIDELPKPTKHTPWKNFFQTGKYYCVTLKVGSSNTDNTQGKNEDF